MAITPKQKECQLIKTLCRLMIQFCYQPWKIDFSIRGSPWQEIPVKKMGNRAVIPLMTRDKTGTSREKTGTSRDKTGTSKDKTGTKQGQAGTKHGQAGTKQGQQGQNRDSRYKPGKIRDKTGTAGTKRDNRDNTGTSREEKKQSWPDQGKQKSLIIQAQKRKLNKAPSTEPGFYWLLLASLCLFHLQGII